ncbi:MAG: helix-turn-helix transcriptional regulator [Clostridia bacterium]|nr:helix-turn-helix transcriptional regulator [Clostridia bacterium]
MRDYFEHRINKSIEIDSIVTIHYFEFDDSYVDKPEEHAFWELVFIDRGECGIVADESRFILKQGQLYIHRPFENHMIVPEKGIPSNVFIISFYSHSDAMRFFEGRILEATMSVRQHIAAIIYEANLTFELLNDPQMKGLSLKSGSVLWAGEQTVQIRLELMLIELVRRGSDRSAGRKMFFSRDIIDDELTLRVVGFLEEHLYSRLTMEEVSRSLSFSKSYLSRHFINICGCSIMDYFQAMKINEAKNLIRSGAKNFFEISELLAFSNPHYFSSVFKRCTGMTPTEYKRSCMKKS